MEEPGAAGIPLDLHELAGLAGSSSLLFLPPSPLLILPPSSLRLLPPSSFLSTLAAALPWLPILKVLSDRGKEGPGLSSP